MKQVCETEVDREKTVARCESNLLHDTLLRELNKIRVDSKHNAIECFGYIVQDVWVNASRIRGVKFDRERVSAFVSSYFRAFLSRDICYRIKIPGDEKFVPRKK